MTHDQSAVEDDAEQSFLETTARSDRYIADRYERLASIYGDFAMSTNMNKAAVRFRQMANYYEKRVSLKRGD